MLPKITEDRLKKKLKIEDASPQKQREVLLAFEALVNQVILSYILDNLSNTDAKAFLKLLEKDKDGKQALDFARKKIPDLEIKTAEKVHQAINQVGFKKCQKT